MAGTGEQWVQRAIPERGPASGAIFRSRGGIPPIASTASTQAIPAQIQKRRGTSWYSFRGARHFYV
ncbi:MAG: hypothetical protein HC888_13470 [Candidatus Competibacteraceae bacterium]|nr:hypothetical protein [Candidatus Competibacteraceae bacterium]